MIEGRVRSETGVVDPTTRSATVVITPSVAGTLLPGQMVKARIFASGGAIPTGVMVQQDAVQTIGHHTGAFLRPTNGTRAPPVQLSVRSGATGRTLLGGKTN